VPAAAPAILQVSQYMFVNFNLEALKVPTFAWQYHILRWQCWLAPAPRGAALSGRRHGAAPCRLRVVAAMGMDSGW
jgi:hypothetical protein